MPDETEEVTEVEINDTSEVVPEVADEPIIDEIPEPAKAIE